METRRHHGISLQLLLTVMLPLCACGADSIPLDPCERVICGYHGSCTVTRGELSCLCDEGFVPTAGPDCVPESNPEDIETILGEAHLIQRVDLDATVDTEGVLSSELDVARVGDFVWWEEPLYDHVAAGNDTTCGDARYLSKNVTLRFAINATGRFYVGALGPPSDALGALLMLDQGVLISSVPNELYQQNKYYPGHQVIENRFTVMFLALTESYGRLVAGGHVQGGPSGAVEVWELSSQIENRYDQPIHVLHSANVCCAPINGCSEDTPYNAYWCPQTGPSVHGLGARGFRLEYSGSTRSLVVVQVAGDGDRGINNSAFVGFDGERVLSCEGPRGAASAMADVFPQEVELTGQRRYPEFYSQYFSQILLFILAEGVIVSDVWQAPEQGMSENPPPMHDVLVVGWNH